jgi:tryptophan synthase alpha chain
VNRIDAAFRGGHKALIGYLCVGDPSVDESIAIARACLEAGADVLELGVPFSDPTADGPAIARASQRAIAAGGGLAATFRAARVLRETAPDAGIVVFGYYNPIFTYGEERAAADAARAGVDALLVVDLPLEESGTLRAAAVRHGIGVVPLLAPTSHEQRVAAVRQVAASGAGPSPFPFVYYVSMTGVTGSGTVDAREAGARAAELRKALDLPVVVGFGIDSREKASAAALGADGVVVGTALVRAVEEGASADERRMRVAKLVRDLREGVEDAGRRAARAAPGTAP